MITKTNAGPEPDNPVTASSSFSSTANARPTDPSNCANNWPSPAVAPGPRQYPLALCPIRQGVLGITRANRDWPNPAASVASGTPAAIETTSFSAAGALSGASAARSCWGLVARNTTSAAWATAALSASSLAPGTALPKASRAAGTGSAATSRSAVVRPACTNPAAKARAICPAPTKPMVSRSMVCDRSNGKVRWGEIGCSSAVRDAGRTEGPTRRHASMVSASFRPSMPASLI